MKKIVYIAFACIALLNLSSCDNRETSSTEIKITSETETAEFWSLKQAIEIMDESVHVSYGIQDNDKFNQIIAQKNKGDENALYVYATLLLLYDIAADVKMTDEEAETEGVQILVDLAEKKHAPACAYLAGSYKDERDREFLEKITKLDSEHLLLKRIDWYHTAIKGGERVYAGFADTLVFRLTRDPNLLLLSDSARTKNKDNLKEAVKAYSVCAIRGRNEYCGARMAEAYYWGYGVDKDYPYAYAWAKFIYERKQSDSVYRNIGALPDIIKKTKSSFNEDALKKAETAYQKLLQDIPPNRVKFGEDANGKPDYVSYTSQWEQGRDEVRVFKNLCRGFYLMTVILPLMAKNQNSNDMIWLYFKLSYIAGIPRRVDGIDPTTLLNVWKNNLPPPL